MLIESYTTDQLTREPVGGFENQDYFYPNEVLKNFKDLQILFYNEGEIGGKWIVQCIAKKPTDKDAVKYGFNSSAVFPIKVSNKIVKKSSKNVKKAIKAYMEAIEKSEITKALSKEIVNLPISFASA